MRVDEDVPERVLEVGGIDHHTKTEYFFMTTGSVTNDQSWIFHSSFGYRVSTYRVILPVS